MGTPTFATRPTTSAPSGPTSLVVPATDQQLSYITTLLGERDWRHAQGVDKYISRAATVKLMIDVLSGDEKCAASQRHHVATADTLGDRINQALAYAGTSAAPEMAFAWAPLTKEGASKLIEWLKSLPRNTRVIETQGQWEEDERRHDVAIIDVPAGRYAIDTGIHAVNGTAFYRVDRPTEDRWAGYVFVKQIIGDGEQRLSQKQSRAILSRIAQAGAEAASARYGHEIGRCGICDRQLTNDESRARGIGPVCATKAGW